MVYRTITLLALAALAATTLNCGATLNSKFYTLNSTAQAEDPVNATYAIGVGPVSVPSAVDRPQFVVEVAENRVEIDEFHRWVAPLDEVIARAVAGNLAILLGTQDVAVTPLASLNPDYRVTIDVQRFDSVPGQAATVDAVWAVRESAGKKSRAGHTLAREAVANDSVDALAAAHSRALAVVSADIAAAIRTLASAAPAKR